MAPRFITVLGIALATVPAFGSDLWNQQTGLGNSYASFVGAIDGTYSDASIYSSYQLSDVIVGAGGWNVTSISMVIIDGDPTVTGINSAILNFFNNTGTALPPGGDDPTTGTTLSSNVTVTAINAANGVYLLTASGLNLNWSAGEYWVGLTSIGSFGSFGEVTDAYQTTNSAGATYTSVLRNPGNGLGDGSAWMQYSGQGSPYVNAYAGIDIQGAFATPEPVSMAIFGFGALGLLARRRRRA